MTKAYSRFLTAFFCIFLGGLLVWHVVLPDRDRSETENRPLTQMPTFTWEGLKDGSYTADIESYFADQFPLRDSWTGLKARVEQLLGKQEFNNIYLVEDSLISRVEEPDQALLDKNFSYIQRLDGKLEVPLYLGLIPTAAEIWKDRLPAGAPTYDQTLVLDQAGNLGLPVIDMAGALWDHTEESIYYRTDHHWTTLGAFYGANALLESLGKDPLKESDFTPEIASDAFYGTLYSQSGVHFLEPDTMEFWVQEEGLSVTVTHSGRPESGPLYNRDFLTVKDKYSAFLGGNQPLCIIKNENLDESAGKLLLIRDSYTDALAPFLAQRFEEVHLLDPRYYRAPASVYVAENGIDDVVVLYSVQNFLTENNLVLLTQ